MSRSLLALKKVDHPRRGPLKLKNLSLSINKGEALGLIGPSGAGKSLLGRILAGGVEPGRGERLASAEILELVSFEAQKSVMAGERYRDDTNFYQGFLDAGTQAGDFIFGPGKLDPPKKDLLARFSLDGLENRGLRFLSTGEFRKCLLCRALAREPDFLILDAPFDGLDISSRRELEGILRGFRREGRGFLIITNRSEDCSPFVSRVLLLAEGRLLFDGPIRQGMEAFRRVEPRMSPPAGQILPPSSGALPSPPPKPTLPLVEMRRVEVSYGSTPILRDLSWTVRSGGHWRIIGPNGAGKSTLLNLITGDNPKGYGQNLYLFGRKKGSGESVWEIKERIGFVSGELHLRHLVDQPLLAVVLSGYYDSIGLYNTPTAAEMEAANLWCRWLGLGEYLDTPFPKLSFGLQRIALILRSLIKTPELLILDEPCHGLEQAYTQWVLDALEIIAAEGSSTLLFVTHDPSHRVAAIHHSLTLVPHPLGGFTGQRGNSSPKGPVEAAQRR